MACEELKIDSTAFLMVHNPYSWIEGNAGELRREADTLDKMKESIVEIYATKFKVTPEEVSALMDAETWIKGSDARELIRCEIIEVQKDG